MIRQAVISTVGVDPFISTMGVRRTISTVGVKALWPFVATQFLHCNTIAALRRYR
jgi:hypothetical protein